MTPSVYLLIPLTDSMREWIEENVSYEFAALGGIPVEHRYIDDLLGGIMEEGFVEGEDFNLHS